MKKSIALLIAIIALVVALPLSVASAQEATTEAVATLTFTEDEINSAFRVTNPANHNISDVYVDLQAENGGQVTISALYTWRTRAGVKSADVATVMTPRLVNGRLFWDVVSITADGKPASAEIVRQVNTHLEASWHRWIAQHAPAGRLTDVSITDADITFTYTPRG